MRSIRTRRAGGAGTTAFLLLALSALAMLFAASASAFSDVNVITGTETWPDVTQSTSVVANRPGSSQVLVAYNDGRGALESPVNYLGVSVSNNNGETFTRLARPTQFTGHGTGYGSPLLAYDQKLGKWIVGQLSSGCGGKGIGLWTSTTGETWTLGACAHSGTKDDKPSIWIDNNSSSPYYGRIYITFNNMVPSNGEDVVTHSDDAVTWSAAKTLFPGIEGTARNINVTGSPESDGKVWAAFSIETLSTQHTMFLSSTDGGESWATSSFLPSTGLAGGATCGGLLAVAPTWTHASWGQIAAGPGGVVGYVWAEHGSTTDEGNVMYTRYTPATGWESAVKLNTDGTTKAQWAPSLRFGSNGTAEATWYDRRNSTNGTNYQRFFRISGDGGKTWQADQPLSTTLIPQPSQPNPNLPACGDGDYNLASSSTGLVGYDTWTDGRIVESGTNVQKVFFRAISLKASPPTAVTENAIASSGSALLFGTVNPNGQATTYQFQYGTTTAYGSAVPVPAGNVGAGTTPVQESNSISGLAHNTTYHYRIIATSTEGTSFGEDRTVLIP